MSNRLCEHMRTWGCPCKYATIEFRRLSIWLDSDLRVLVRDVAGAANWCPEQTAALSAMAADENFEAIREWMSSPAWRRIASEGGNAAAYARDVQHALGRLADYLEGVVRHDHSRRVWCC